MQTGSWLQPLDVGALSNTIPPRSISWLAEHNIPQNNSFLEDDVNISDFYHLIVNMEMAYENIYKNQYIDIYNLGKNLKFILLKKFTNEHSIIISYYYY